MAGNVTNHLGRLSGPGLPEGTEEALPTRVARLREDMMEFAEEPRGGDNR